MAEPELAAKNFYEAVAVNQQPTPDPFDEELELPELSFEDQQRLVDANYGRDFGWYVLSRDGKQIAELTDCRWEEMFWDSYVVTPLDGHVESLSADFWHPSWHRVRNREVTDLEIDIIGGGWDPDTNRAGVRGAYWYGEQTIPKRRTSLLSFLGRLWKRGT